MTDRAEFERKLARALAEVEAAGIWPANYDPWVDRWLRQRGLRLRPPYYRNPWRYGVAMGVYFASFWGLSMWLFLWRSTGLANLWAFGAAIFAGALFGLFMAMYMAWGRRRHRLTRWEEL